MLLPNFKQDISGISASKPALCCLNLRKIFLIISGKLSWRIILGFPSPHEKHVTALDGISFSVPRGKIVGIIGKNGAGKSTLLRVLAGVYSPTSGYIEVDGLTAGLFELGGGGNPYLTGREYVERVLRLHGASHRQMQSLIAEIAEFSELGEFFERRIHTYSTGMAVRLYFATATAIQHEVYLIDEILSVGDEHFQNKCWQRIRERLTGGASGVLVTHDWTAILRLCEESHILDKGRIAQSGPSDKVVVSYLDLPKITSKVARFIDRHDGGFICESGTDFVASIEFEVFESCEAQFSYSIEMLRVGIGWEILLLSKPEPVATVPGRYRILLKIPKLPLFPGRYMLNIFLSEFLSGMSNVAVAYDARSWTHGNAIPLLVTGDLGDTLIRMPILWKVC